MIKSMTGYGIFRDIIAGREITVEIKSVNHRYFDFQCNYPRSFGYIENKMKAYIANDIKRGRVFVSVSIYTIEDRDTTVAVNTQLARNYIDGLREKKDELNLEDDLSLTSLLDIKDIFLTKRNLPDEEEIWSSVQEVAAEALNKFNQMTIHEGQELKKDILLKIEDIKKEISVVEKLAPESVKIYQDNLRSKLFEILEEKNIDDSRILTEAAIFADKVSTDEEIVRLKSHLDQTEDLLASEEDVVGRMMDFLIQELNREINTIGSKAQSIEITKSVVFLKSEVEKIREQIQNIV